MQQYYSITELTERLSVHRNTVERWIVEGRLPNAVKLAGKTWRVPEYDLTKFLKESRRERTSSGTVSSLSRQEASGSTEGAVPGQVPGTPPSFGESNAADESGESEGQEPPYSELRGQGASKAGSSPPNARKRKRDRQAAAFAR